MAKSRRWTAAFYLRTIHTHHFAVCDLSMLVFAVPPNGVTYAADKSSDHREDDAAAGAQHAARLLQGFRQFRYVIDACNEAYRIKGSVGKWKTGAIGEYHAIPSPVDNIDANALIAPIIQIDFPVEIYQHVVARTDVQNAAAQNGQNARQTLGAQRGEMQAFGQMVWQKSFLEARPENHRQPE